MTLASDQALVADTREKQTRRRRSYARSRTAVRPGLSRLAWRRHRY